MSRQQDKIQLKKIGAGRPRRFDTNKILDNALELFWKKGFASTTTREIERELSLNQSSLYNTFGSKAAFFDAVLDRYESLTSEALIKPLEESTEGINALEQFFVDLILWVTHDARRGCLLINLMAEDGGRDEAILVRTKRYRDRVKQAILECLERAADQGEISSGDSGLRAQLLLALALGLNIAARGGCGKTELKAIADAIQYQIHSWLIK